MENEEKMIVDFAYSVACRSDLIVFCYFIYREKMHLDRQTKINDERIAEIESRINTRNLWTT